MSEIRVDSIKNQAGTGAPLFPNGLRVTGVITATTGIITYYGDGSGLTNLPAAASGITSIVQDTNPQLGGNLNLNNKNITGTGNVNITGIITSTTVNGTHTGTWTGVGIGTTYGGTGQTTYTTGDILYSSATNTLAKLPLGLAGQVLTVSGGLPAWANAAGGGGGSGAGLGLYNTGINNAVGYPITNVLTAAFTAPATAGYRYIVYSIQVTNISPTTAANLTADITGSTYPGNVTLAYTLPIQTGTSIELLKRPKILNPSDTIRLLASANSILHATITYQSTTTTNYFGSGVNITTTSATDLYSAGANSVVESVLLANTEGTSDVKATVTWTNSSNTIQGYYVSEFVIPADSTIEILEAPKYITNGNKIRVQANVANRLAAIVSGITV